MRLIILIFLLISVISRISSLNINRESDKESIVKIFNYRLPNNILPKIYSINLEPHIDDGEFTFTGTSSILFEILLPTQDVILHASESIVIDKIYTKIIYNNGTTLDPISQNWNSTLEFFTIHFNCELGIGNYTLKLKWKGHNNSTGKGIYRTFYQNKDEKDKIPVVTTAFQATAARSGYPCWDEPVFRVQFELSLKHSPKYTALSNMPVKTIATAEDGKVWTIFKPSLPMPTYMLAFVIAPYTNLTNKYGNMTFWIPSAELKNAEVAFNLSQKIIPFMEKYTGIPYAFPKMDQVMAPKYPGAIEHWGLITYSPAILYNSESNDIEAKDLSMSLAAHEIAHQWFGNLVTPAWWSDIWLSESFATFFTRKILDGVLNNWNSFDFFNIITLGSETFSMDSEEDESHPIKRSAETPLEIQNMFDTTTYIKGNLIVNHANLFLGAGVLQMLENILSEEIFLKGIRNYFKKYKFSSVVTDDLWHALQEVYSKEKISPELNIKEIMDPWLEQSGLPFINMTRDYKTGYITLTQGNNEKSVSPNLWTIPINYITASKLHFSSTRPIRWMQRSNDSLLLTDIPKDDWIIFNIQNKDFYRVNYDFENWKRIIEYLNSDNYQKIHVRNRSRLLIDFLQIAIKESSYHEMAIDMLSYLRREIDALPWIALTRTFDWPINIFKNTPNYSILSKWVLYVMNNIVDRIGFENRADDHHLDIQVRERIVQLACRHGHDGCQAATTSKLVENFMDKSKYSSNSYTRLSHCLGLMKANETIWDIMMDNYYTNPKNTQIFDNLGCTKNHTLIRKYFDLAFVENKTLAADNILYAFESLADNMEPHFDIALDLFIEKYETIYEIEKNITDEIDMTERIFSMLSSEITLSRQYKKFISFVNEQIVKEKMNASSHTTINAAMISLTTNEKLSKIVNSFVMQGKFSY